VEALTLTSRIVSPATARSTKSIEACQPDGRTDPDPSIKNAMSSFELQDSEVGYCVGAKEGGIVVGDRVLPRFNVNLTSSNNMQPQVDAVCEYRSIVA